MALETATYISDLVSTNPTASDNISQGDDHIRLLKATVKATFPNITGALNPTHTMVNTWFGSGDGTGTPVDAVITAPSGSGTNIAGADVIVKAGNGTGTGGSGYISFQTAAAGSSGSTANTLTERMRIDANGNVGIGTAGPSYKLDVVGTLRSTGQANFDNAINLTTATLNYIYYTSALSFSQSGTAERMRIDSSGNVGIGTSSPSTRLHIADSSGGGNGRIRMSCVVSAGYDSRIFQDDNGLNFSAVSDSRSLIFRTGNSDIERLRIGPSGQLGIGGANYGTSGQVLTSNGSAAAPSWQTPSSSVTVTTYSSGSGTWTKPSTGTFARVRMWAGGGSGGKNVGTGSTINASGGGGGGYIEHTYQLSDLGATVSYSIGAGGTAITATSNTAGNPGGNTTFGSLTVYGGSGGLSTGASVNGGNWIAVGGNTANGMPWDGGTGTDGASTSSKASQRAAYYGGAGGGGGGDGTTISNTTAGGTSVLGGAGGAGNSTSGGTAGSGTAPGGGGGGKANNTTGSSGAGAAGRIEIWVW